MAPSGPALRSKADARAVLLRVGFDPERIEAALAGLPDPFDLDREQQVFAQHAITQGELMELLGGSP